MTYKPVNPKPLAEFPGVCYAQADPAGVRCIATKDGLFTALGRKIVSATHIEEVLAPSFQHFPELVLEGELFLDDYETTVHHVRRRSYRQDAAPLAYHIYDIPSLQEHPFPVRWNSLDNLLGRTLRPLVRVPTDLCLSQGDLDNAFLRYKEMGYTNQFIRYEEKFFRRSTEPDQALRA